ncbi:MAG: S-layer homology domain-containing protein [Clostridia bacterium]|nr:S-layer homology domain-containing protein [Clostridia bacterium]
MKKTSVILRALVALVCVAIVMGCLPLSIAATPFSDVKANAYYAAAVEWAVSNNITAGTTPTTFSPNDACTRGQIVAFLWRAYGQPNPGTATAPFTDVSKNAYYYKAVLWAVESGITSGTSATTFSPNDACTRGQIVSFLWRAAGQPTPSATSAPFTDVGKTAYYYKAVLWAVENGITSGTSATAFSPNGPCTRGQIVAFLFRYLGSVKIDKNPTDYQMTSSSETAAFTVTVKDGRAPYTYTWHLFRDTEHTTYAPVKTSKKSNTFSLSVTDYDFDYYRDIYAYCVVTDADGKQAISGNAYVLQYHHMVIRTQPSDHHMTYSQEEVEFDISIMGGVAPYTYKWTICYDNDDRPQTPVVTDEASHTFKYTFSDYDFDAYNGIYVYCEITDATNRTVTSEDAYVYPKN